MLADNLEAVEHQILQNWFRLHLVNANRQNKVTFEDIPCNSSLYWQDNDYKGLYYDNQPFTTESGNEIKFFPDIVFKDYAKADNKSLLFFVEIDCAAPRNLVHIK